MKPGRRPKLTPKQIEWARANWRRAAKVQDLAIGLRISEGTLYLYAKRHNFGPHPNRDHAYQPRTKTEAPIPTKFTCPRCGCRCEWPQGHESWCNEWLQQRYRVGAA
jgi:hypothetical protein